MSPTRTAKNAFRGSLRFGSCFTREWIMELIDDARLRFADWGQALCKFWRRCCFSLPKLSTFVFYSYAPPMKHHVVAPEFLNRSSSSSSVSGSIVRWWMEVVRSRLRFTFLVITTSENGGVVLSEPRSHPNGWKSEFYCSPRRDRIISDDYRFGSLVFLVGVGTI